MELSVYQFYPAETSKMTARKLVRILRDNTMRSIYETPHSVNYSINHRMYEEAKPDHGGGYYVYRHASLDELKYNFYQGRYFDLRRIPMGENEKIGVLVVEIEPPFVFYDVSSNSIPHHFIRGDNWHKMAVSGVTPHYVEATFDISHISTPRREAWGRLIRADGGILVDPYSSQWHQDMKVLGLSNADDWFAKWKQGVRHWSQL